MLDKNLSEKPEKNYGKEITYNAGDKVVVGDLKTVFKIPRNHSISELMTLDKETGDVTCSLKIKDIDVYIVSKCSHSLQEDRKKLWKLVFRGIKKI